MDKEDKAQLESEAPQITQDSEPILPNAEDTKSTEAGGVEEPITEQIKEVTATETAAAAADTTNEQLNEEPVNQSNVISLLETGQVKEASQETELPDPTVTAPETLDADEDVTLILPDATPLPVSVSDASPVTETTEEIKDADPNHEGQDLNMAVEISRAESENESACLIPDTKLAEVEAEGPGFEDTSVAADDEGTEPSKEEIKDLEFLDSSPAPAPAAAPIVEAELMPESKPSEAAAVTVVPTGKENTPDQLKVEKADASTVLLAETVDAETEVAEVLPEKKKKRALGDHLAEEKENDSVSANKQASDEKCEVLLLQAEQMADAVAPTESTDISSRDVNTADDTKTEAEADENKEENVKVVENVAPTGEVTATEVTQVREGDKVAKKEPIAAGEAGKEEVASKLTSRGSSNILSKVKHQIVKVKKAIVRRTPSSKNIKVEIKDDIKVN